jgi:RNA polymerase sigma-70 factor (ECF subfamily)
MGGVHVVDAITERTAATDSELLGSRDDRDFRVVFERHVDAIHAYVAARIGLADADDVVAETFATAWRERDRFRPDADSARPWLYGIATVLLRRHRAIEQRWIAGLRHDAVQGRGVDDRDLGAGIVDPVLVLALAQLSHAEREILLLVSLGDLTVAQAARAAGIGAVAARMRMHRARTRVIHFLKTDEEQRP